MCDYVEKSSPESGRCPQVESRYDKYPPSAGVRPPEEIRHEQVAPSVGHRPPVKICHEVVVFVCETHILCVSRVLHMKSALGASR